MVTLDKVNKIYPGGFHAVHDVNVEIANGEFVVLVGPSGCGKSSTLRMIAGLEDISSGDIHIGNRLVNQVPPVDRDIAMVFQSYALYPHMTVRQNMAFSLKMRRTPKAQIDARVTESAQMLSIGNLLDRRPQELSGGQRQRVAVGRAIVRNPAVFLFDEPLSDLDAQLRAQMRTEIAALHQRLGATMIYVTHDQVEAMTLGDRLVLMKEGIVQQVGKPLEVYHRPANQFVASFIGSPAMNLFQGTVAGEYFCSAGDGARWPVKGAPDGPAVFGVRPENLVPATNGDPVFADAERTLIEHMGHEALVHFEIVGRTYIARVAVDVARDLEKKQSLTLRNGAYNLFADNEEGCALVHAGNTARLSEA
ncbi:MAG: ABC transporter ATP-binding protein [Aeoliella sp.]